MKPKFEDKFEKCEQYGFKAYIKKKFENETTLHIIRYFKIFIILSLKCDLENLQDANKNLREKCAKITEELEELQVKMKKN